MKKLFLALLMMIATASASYAMPDSLTISNDTTKKHAQWTDISFFHINRLDAKNSTPLIWFNHENDNYFVESRINFDWSNTAGILIGKTFSKSEKFWITPKLGILFAGRNTDGYNALSPECNFGGRIGAFGYFTMNQYAIAIDEHPDFVYQYTELRWFIDKHVTLAYATQFYKENWRGSEWWIDGGPAMAVSLGKVYIKPWMTWDPGHQNRKFIVGVGYKL